MRKLIFTLGILLFSAIVTLWWFYSPLPMQKGRTAIGTKTQFELNGKKYHYYPRSTTPRAVLLLASAGREVSDFNELVMALNQAGFMTIAVEAPGIGGTKIPEQADLAFLADPSMTAYGDFMALYDPV